MTKILNFALKIKGGGGREGGTCEILRPCHPPQKKNLERALSRQVQRNSEVCWISINISRASGAPRV